MFNDDFYPLSLWKDDDVSLIIVFKWYFTSIYWFYLYERLPNSDQMVWIESDLQNNVLQLPLQVPYILLPSWLRISPLDSKLICSFRCLCSLTSSSQEVLPAYLCILHSVRCWISIIMEQHRLILLLSPKGRIYKLDFNTVLISNHPNEHLSTHSRQRSFYLSFIELWRSSSEVVRGWR